MKSGPSSMVRALDLLERRQITLKTVSKPELNPDRPLKIRISVGVAVWALTIVFLILGGASATLRYSSFWTILTGVFVTSWTILLLILLRRLAAAK